MPCESRGTSNQELKESWFPKMLTFSKVYVPHKQFHYRSDWQDDCDISTFFDKSRHYHQQTGDSTLSMSHCQILRHEVSPEVEFESAIDTFIMHCFRGGRKMQMHHATWVDLLTLCPSVLTYPQISGYCIHNHAIQTLKYNCEQECIPVGWLTPAHWAHLVVFEGRRACLGDVCMPGGGGMHAWGVCMPGGCACLGGVHA